MTERRVLSSTARRDGDELVIGLATDSGFEVKVLSPVVAASLGARIFQVLGAIATTREADISADICGTDRPKRLPYLPS